MNDPKPVPASALTSAALVVLGASILPQAKSDKDAAELLARVEAARGRSTKALDTLAVEGTFEIRFDEAGSEPVASGQFRESWDGRKSYRHTGSMADMTDLESGFCDGVVWEIDPNAGAKVRLGAEATALERYMALLRGAPASDLYRKVESQGTRDLDGQAHVILNMTPTEGDIVDTWWVEPKSARVTRIDLKLPTPQDCVMIFGFPEWSTTQVRFGDWKRFDGADFPCKRTVRMGSMETSSTATKVERGVTLDSARQKLPDVVVKAAARKSDPASDYEIVDRAAQPTAAVRLQCKKSELMATLAPVFAEVIGVVKASGDKMAGLPYTRYHTREGDLLDVEAGIPVAKAIEAKGRVKPCELPAGRTLMAWHIGRPEDLPGAHDKLMRHADEEGLEPRGGSWETYWTDPGMVPDPTKWRTQLFLPVE